MVFPRQKYWSGLPFPSPEKLPDPGIEPRSPALQACSLPTEPPGKPQHKHIHTKYYHCLHWDKKNEANKKVWTQSKSLSLATQWIQNNPNRIKNTSCVLLSIGRWIWIHVLLLDPWFFFQYFVVRFFFSKFYTLGNKRISKEKDWCSLI